MNIIKYLLCSTIILTSSSYGENLEEKLDLSGYKQGLSLEIYDLGKLPKEPFTDTKELLHLGTIDDTTPAQMYWLDDLSEAQNITSLLLPKANMTFVTRWKGKFLAKNKGDHLFLAELTAGSGDNHDGDHNVAKCLIDLKVNHRKILEVKINPDYMPKLKHNIYNSRSMPSTTVAELNMINLDHGLHDYEATLSCVRNYYDAKNFYSAITVDMKVKTPTDQGIKPIPKELLLYRP